MFRRFHHLAKYNELLLNLVIRDIKVRYKGSILGVAWAMMEPLLWMALFTVVFSEFLQFDVPNYPVFVLSGLLPWSFFSTSLLYSTNSISSNGSLVKKIYFPREILPLSVVLGRMVHFLLSLLLFIPFLVFLGLNLSPVLLFFPLLVVVEFLLIFGVSLITTALNTFYTDVGFLLQFALNAFFFLVPIFYPVSYVPESYRNLYLLNPVAAIVESFRKVLYEGVLPDAVSLTVATGFSVLVVWVGYRIFSSLEPRFAEIL